MNETQALLSLNFVDYIIIGVVVVSTLISLLRGFLKEIVSLFIWVLGFWVAFKFYHVFAIMLEPYVANAAARQIGSFAGIFILVLILGVIFNHLFSLIITKTGLSGTDRVLGMLFGFTRGVLLVSVILLLVSATSFVQEAWWRDSALIPHFQVLINLLKDFIPEKVMSMVGM